MSYEDLERAASEIRALAGRETHDFVLVLGSGLSSYAESLPRAKAIPYTELPGFTTPTVEGHAGTLFSAELGDAGVIALAGRTHL
ncbi:MAG: purine-nucleoside phosphorylase, partial [Acidimicrobiia bacterium]